MMKTSMREVADAIASEQGAERKEEAGETDPLGWTMKALKALRRNDTPTQRKCVLHYPMLQDLVPQGPQALRDHAISIAKELAVTELRDLAEAEKEKGYDLADIEHRKQHLMTKLKKLTPGRAGALSKVKRQDGSTTSDPAEVSAEFRQHWSQVFGKRTHSRHLLPQWIREDLHELPNDNWHVDPEHLKKAIEQATASSPGPDGIPLAAWRLLGPLGEQVLWEALQMLVDPGQEGEVVRDWKSLNESAQAPGGGNWSGQ